MTSAHELTMILGGTWFGSYGVAPCPVCQPQRRKDQAALSLGESEDRLLLKCHRSGCKFCEVLAAAGQLQRDYRPPDPADVARKIAAAQARTERHAEIARRVWDEALPIQGSPAETYLQGRGISCSLPHTLRFHPHCFHRPSGSTLPAMIALVEGGKSFAIHRTYLRPDGRGKAGLPRSDKMMLGQVSGGAVWLSDKPGRLVVAEGIESALSLNCGILKGPLTVCAALSTSGMRSLSLPDQIGQLVIACDGDRAGRQAAHVLDRRAGSLGWNVFLRDPGDDRDFNDVLQQRLAIDGSRSPKSCSS